MNSVSCSVSLCRLRSTGILDFAGSCALHACMDGSRCQPLSPSCLRSTPFLPHWATSSSSSLHLLKNNAIAGNTKHFDEMDLAGSVCLDGMKVDNIVQTFDYVPVDSKHYVSYSFAFVNHQAEQFRRCWPQLQADKRTFDKKMATLHSPTLGRCIGKECIEGKGGH